MSLFACEHCVVVGNGLHIRKIGRNAIVETKFLDGEHLLVVIRYAKLARIGKKPDIGIGRSANKIVGLMTTRCANYKRRG